MAFILLCSSIFLSFPILHVYIENLCHIFSSSIGNRILEHGIHMDDKLSYCVIENQAHCSYPSGYLSILLSFLDKFVSHFLRN